MNHALKSGTFSFYSATDSWVVQSKVIHYFLNRHLYLYKSSYWADCRGYKYTQQSMTISDEKTLC